MKVEYLGGPKTPGDDCPAVYRSDRDTYLIQGYRIPEEYRAAVRNLSDNEDVVEVPAHLVEVIKQL